MHILFVRNIHILIGQSQPICLLHFVRNLSNGKLKQIHPQIKPKTVAKIPLHEQIHEHRKYNALPIKLHYLVDLLLKFTVLW